MSFWNNPENNSIKILIAVVAVAALGAFVFYKQNASEETTGRVISVPSMTTGTTAAPASVICKAGNYWSSNHNCVYVGADCVAHADTHCDSSTPSSTITFTGGTTGPGANPTTADAAPLEGSACTHTGTSGSGEIAGGECCFPSPQPSGGYTNCFTSPNSVASATLSANNMTVNFSGSADTASKALCRTGLQWSVQGNCVNVIDCNTVKAATGCTSTTPQSSVVYYPPATAATNTSANATATKSAASAQ